jgi:hypothetical protein
MSKWFTVNKVALSLDKMKITKLATNNSPQCALSVGYNGKYIEESANTKFLGLQIDNRLNWKNHIDQIILKLSGACYAVRSMYHIVNIDTMKSIYFAYFQSIMKCGIIFWGNLSSSKRIFTLQKKIIRIMAGAKPRNSCRSLFKELEILPLPCEYIFSLMNFIINNPEIFRQIQLYTVPTQGTGTIFRDQLPSFHVFRKVLTTLASKCSTIYHPGSDLF